MKSSSRHVRLAARASDQRWRAAMAGELGAPSRQLIDQHGVLPQIEHENDNDA